MLSQSTQLCTFNSMKSRVLIIDDDIDVLESLAEMLGDEYAVTKAQSGVEGLALAKAELPDLVILDLRLNDRSGIEVCEALRGDIMTQHIPVLMLTGYGELANRVNAFSAGADDFVEKPVVAAEILARVKSKLRRSQEMGRQEVLKCGNLSLDPKKFEAKIGDRIISFSALEFKLLSLFIVNKNKILDRRRILESIWGDVSVSERTIDAHLVSVRKKLEGFDHELRSVYGAGFILRAKEPSQT